MYVVKTGRLLGHLCEDGRPREDIIYIWRKNDQETTDEDDLVYCLTSSCTINFNPATGTVVSQVNHANFLDLPKPKDNVVKVEVTFKDQTYQLDRVYCVVKLPYAAKGPENIQPIDKTASGGKIKRKMDCYLTGYATHKKKSFKFGQVNQCQNNVLFAANPNIVIKVALAVVGKKSTKLSFFTREGLCLDSHFVPKDRPITCLAIHPTELAAASGDKSGKIFVWRNSHDDPNRFVSSQMHWHSLPVRALSWANDVFSDSRYLFSGGEEGAILKWETRSAKRVAIVPRIGCTITHISATARTVVTANSNNSLKLFSANLEDITTIVGLAQGNFKVDTRHEISKSLSSDVNFDKFFQLANGTAIWKYNYLEEKRKTKIFFHNGVQAIALLNGPKNQIQLFDPIMKTEKLALDVASFNKVLGDREEQDNDLNDKESNASKIVLFSLSRCGTWLATVESNHDTLGSQSIKIWRFLSPSSSMGEGKFELNTQINEDLSCQLLSVDFLKLPNRWATSKPSRHETNGLITCGTDKKAKLWRLAKGEPTSAVTLSSGKWEAERTFEYLEQVPTCTSGSPDQSVLAIGFGSKLTMWDTENHSLLTCLSLIGDESNYTSVAFGDGSNKSHLVLGTTDTHVLVWNLLNNHLVRKMELDRATLLELNSNLTAILHSHGAIALDRSLQVSTITRLENINGITIDEKTNSIYILHSTEKCQNVLKCVKLDQSSKITSSSDAVQTSNNDEIFGSLSQPSIKELGSRAFSGQKEERVNMKLLTHDLITTNVSECSASFVKLAMPL